MSHTRREAHQIPYLPGYAYDISIAIWRLDDCRARTIHALADLHPSQIHRQPAPLSQTIAYLLDHIAATEAHWLFRVVQQRAIPDAVQVLFAAPIPAAIDDNYILREWSSHSPDDTPTAVHLHRLKVIREHLHQTYTTMRIADYRRLHAQMALDDLPSQEQATPEWVLHHLAQSEAERRREIQLLRLLQQTDTP